MVVTKELIMQGRSGSGGWNQRQLALLGIQYPPTSGWIDRAVGLVLSDDDARLFLELTGKTKKGQASAVLLEDACSECHSTRTPLAVFRVINGRSIVEPTCRDCSASWGVLSTSDAKRLLRENKILFIESARCR